MSAKPRYFTIGVFVIVVTALGLLGLVVLSQDALRSPKHFIETYVDESVQGIDVGTPFKFRGVKAGNVSEISLVSSVYETRKMYVMVRVALEEHELMKDEEEWRAELKDMIDRGLRLKLVPQGITGLSFLEAEFYPMTDAKPLEIDWEPECAYIPSTPAMMTLLSRSIERLSAEINTLDLEAIGRDVQDITRNLNASSKNIERITSDIAEASDEVIANISLASGNLPKISTNLVESTRAARGVIADSSRDLDRVMMNLRYITEDTKEFIRMIKRHPGMLLSEPPEKNLTREGK